MTIFCHELRQGRKAFSIWTASNTFLILTCVLLFPEMKAQMEGVTDLFASMGSFTAAFGMDRLSFGTLTGFYSIECGNILGLGGAFFAALLGISALAKEEKEHTAEFLLSHPVSRARIVTEKLAAVLTQILAMNLIVWALACASVAAVGEAIPWKELGLLHLAFALLQVELAGLCFGLSAALRRGSLGIGLGLAALAYFLNIIANLTDGARFLKYITPFGYTEGADIILSGSLDARRIALGMAYAAVAIGAAYLIYCKKDIRA